MFPVVAAAIRRLNEAGLPVIIVTNQSGVGRGYFPESLVHTVNELMTQQLAEGGAKIEDRKSTRLNSSHTVISYAVFCLKKKKNDNQFENTVIDNPTNSMNTMEDTNNNSRI